MLCFCFCKNVKTLKSVSLSPKLLNVLLHLSHNGQRLLWPFSSAWLPLASTSSVPSLPPPFSFQKEVSGLDDGVPVKIILDVISWHAVHLEVSGRDHVLLVHLRVVSWREGRGERGSEDRCTQLWEGARKHIMGWAGQYSSYNASKWLYVIIFMYELCFCL